MTVAEQAQFFSRLVDKQFVSETVLRDLREKHQDDVLAVLLHLCRSDPKLRNDLGKAYGDHMGVAYVDPARTLIQYDLVRKLPEKFAKAKRVLPLYDFGGAITVATPTPRDASLIAQTENHFDTFVSPLFAFPDQIESVLEIAYQTDSALTQMIASLRLPDARSSDGTISAEKLRELSEDRAIIDFCRGLILYGLRNRASDIHIEPAEDTVRIRYRIDGVLQTILRMEPTLHPPIVTRLKILAGADIAETRRPQDGRIKLPLSYRSIDLRFSSVPTIYGEKIVLRILGQTQFPTVPDLVELDFSKTVLNDLKKIAEAPHGIFFLTGPTGSGKTTTLYSMLKYLNQPGVNIMTIENPVEYRLEGVNQIQINEGIGLNFADALRAILRQDPDIILIGEIRDFETAQVACRAALTGHLVLTTLHTNNALQAIHRLVEIGVEPPLVAPAVAGVMAQRLVRRLCDYCKEPYQPSPEIMNELFDWDGATSPTFYKARGCEKCNGIGYFGRVAIHEIFPMTDEVRALIVRGAPASEVTALAESQGFMPLRYDGLKKVLRGIATLEEVDRVTED